MSVRWIGCIALLTVATPGRAQAPTLDNLAFLAGCWNGQFRGRQGPGVIEEHWTAPTTNVILGTTRYIVQGVTTTWELSVIATDSAGATLTPHPRGQAPVPFRLVRADSASATFENLAHDFPQRIAYRRVGPDTLVARIEADTPRQRGAEWRMSRVACP